MNSKFYIALKRVYHRWYDSPIAIEDLTSAYNELLSFMIDPKNQLNNNLKGYARGSYNEITELQLVYEKHHKQLRENDFKKLTSEELDKLQLESDYYREVLSLCEDARAILLEYLACYYPELLQGKEMKVILQQLLPFSVIVKRLFEDTKSIDENQSLRDKIESSLYYMLEEDPRKHCQILQEEDCNNLIDIAFNYFNSNLKVPKTVDSIKMVNTSKGNVVWTFKDLFKKVYPSKSYPDSLFNLLITCFDQYRMDTISNLRKTKKPLYFYETLNKNK